MPSRRPVDELARPGHAGAALDLGELVGERFSATLELLVRRPGTEERRLGDGDVIERSCHCLLGMGPILVRPRLLDSVPRRAELHAASLELVVCLANRGAAVRLLGGIAAEERIDLFGARTQIGCFRIRRAQPGGAVGQAAIAHVERPQLAESPFVHTGSLSREALPLPIGAVMEIGLTIPSRRALRLDRAVAWNAALGGLVAASIVARTWAAWLRATPNYFPDEGIYTALSRSIAHGHLPMVRGHVAHFPALLQPILTAPAWWFGSLDTGYRIAQAIESVVISTAGLAVFWTARRLGVGRSAALAAAALALAVPDVGYSGWLLAESFAYPLFVAAVGAGAVALAQPTRRSQATFLGFALLATFARMQLAVLLLAYLVAALVVGRLREQRLVLGGLGLAVLVALAGGLGYYRKAPAAFHLVSPGALGRNAIVLAVAAGWIVVPAGLLGLAGALRSRSAEERAFAAFALAAGTAVLAEATLYGDGAVAHERYGCYLLPLLALGFALHAERGWPWRRAHALIAAVMLAVSATVPMSSWAAAGRNAHSLVLTGLLRVEALAGSPGGGALLVAAVVAVLSLVSLVCAWRRLTLLAAALGVAFCIAASAFATSFDVQNSRNVKAAFLPAGADWAPAGATVVAGSSRTSTLEQFFWNRRLAGLALLPGTAPPDVFAVTPTRVTAAGRLAGLAGPVVLNEDDEALVPVAPLRANGPWLSARTPQLGARIAGRYGDGWLAPAGRVTLFRGSITFSLVAPERMTLKLGSQVVRLPAHRTTRLTLTGCGSAAYRFSSYGYAGLRVVSARSSFPRWSGGSGCTRSTIGIA